MAKIRLTPRDAAGHVGVPVVIDIPVRSSAPGGLKSLRDSWFMQTNGSDPVQQLINMEKWFGHDLAGSTSNMGRGMHVDGSPGGTVPFTEALQSAKRHMEKWQVPEIARRGEAFTLGVTFSAMCNPTDNDQTPDLKYRKQFMADALNGKYNQVYEDIAAILASKKAGGKRTFRWIMRLMHEMDGLFYVHCKWAHSEEEFAALWNLVVGIFRSVDPDFLFDYGSNGPSFITTVEEMQRRFVASGAGNIPISVGDDRWCHEYGFPGSVADGNPNGPTSGGADMYVGGGMGEELYFIRLNRALEWCRKHKLPFAAWEIGAYTAPDKPMTDAQVLHYFQMLFHGGKSGNTTFPGLASLPADELEAVSYFIMQGDYSFQSGQAPKAFKYLTSGPAVSATSSGLGGKLLVV